MYIQRGPASLFLGEVDVLFCSDLQGTLRWGVGTKSVQATNDR
jgi:hypothetical protein